MPHRRLPSRPRGTGLKGEAARSAGYPRVWACGKDGSGALDARPGPGLSWGCRPWHTGGRWLPRRRLHAGLDRSSRHRRGRGVRRLEAAAAGPQRREGAERVQEGPEGRRLRDGRRRRLRAAGSDAPAAAAAARRGPTDPAAGEQPAPPAPARRRRRAARLAGDRPEHPVHEPLRLLGRQLDRRLDRLADGDGVGMSARYSSS